MDEIRFEETQYFRRRWAWAAVIVFNAFFIYIIIQQLVLGIPFGPKPASNGQLLLFELIPLCFLVLLLSIRLKTKYTPEGIYYRYYPFQLKITFIAWHELRDAYLREYHSLYEFGGWGIRVGNRGAALNTSQSCNIGLQLQFQDGKLLLIGTKNPGELDALVKAVMASGKINRGI